MMADELDAGLSLNLNIETIKKSNYSKKNHETIRGDRGKRIKARQQIKRFKEIYRVTEQTLVSKDESHVSKSSEQTSSVNKNEEKIGNISDEVKRKGRVISSLFRHNPDIPSVQSSHVQQVREDLFSSDSFKDTPLHPYMVTNLEKLGFTMMTAIQQDTLPKLMAKHDVLVKSQTGSGKTMAYAIPIIEDLCRMMPKIQRADGCYAIVLVPTRELALQSYDVFLKLIKPFSWIVPGCIIGGEKRKAEKARLRRGVNILIATPGRLIDHMENTKSLLLHRIKWFVLDEADRLLDLGFEAKVSKILEAVDSHSPARQTVLLSATLTEGVERLAGMSLKNPCKVTLNKNSDTSLKSNSTNEMLKQSTEDMQPDTKNLDLTSDSFVLPESLKQYFVITPCKLRLVLLLVFILAKCKKELKTKMIVFVSTQYGVEFLYRLVTYLASDHKSDSEVEDEEDKEVKTSLNVYRLHGDMSQKDRTLTFHDFCSNNSGVLLCTDVAARGLHLPAVQWVVQYSCAAGLTDYVHRVGRTARVGKVGKSVLFLLPSEVDFVSHIHEKHISIKELKLDEILKDVLYLLPSLPGIEEIQKKLPTVAEEAATYLQNCCELFVQRNKEMSAIAKKAYQSYIQAYATYPANLKSIFHIKYLHLGHVAKTFGFRETPTDITNMAGVNFTLIRKRKQKDNERQKMKRQRRSLVSEYTSPLVFSVKMKKKAQKQRL